MIRKHHASMVIDWGTRGMASIEGTYLRFLTKRILSEEEHISMDLSE